jgi:hypothetical protein
MQANGGFRLIVRRGPQPNQVYELANDVITLGRDITNDIVINDPEVSRHHCRLTRTPSGYTLEDLGSTNGTFVNGQRLSAARPLSNGDMVGLGETVTMAYEGAGIPIGMGPSRTVVGAPPPGQVGTPPMGIPPHPQPYAPQPQPYVQPLQQPQEYLGAPQQDAYYEESAQGSSTLRYVLLGCGFLVVLCVVMTVVAVIVIDYGNLWCDIPLGPTIVRLVGGFCP